MATSVTRTKVLSLYRKILRTAKHPEYWKDPEIDCPYIPKEARRLFKRNSVLTDPERIQVKIDEASQRYDIGLHYGIPHPKIQHIPMDLNEEQRRAVERSTIYLSSYFDEDEFQKE